MLHDPWLDRWLPAIGARASGRPVLEIGCGDGDDTRTLVNAGFDVMAFDLSDAAVRRARQAAPAARIEQRDIRDPLPQTGNGFGVVIASLSLHYFPWSETLDIAARIHRVLAPGGLLLCRLNSTEDHHFGARGHPVIEPHYHLVNGSPKRFFTEAAVRELFAEPWTVIALEHRTTRKYLRTKAFWEVAASA